MAVALTLVVMITSIGLTIVTMRLIDKRLPARLPTPWLSVPWLSMPYEMALLNRHGRREGRELAVAAALRYLLDCELIEPSASSIRITGPIPSHHSHLDVAIHSTIAGGDDQTIATLCRAPAVTAALDELEKGLEGLGVIHGRRRRDAIALSTLWCVPAAIVGIVGILTVPETMERVLIAIALPIFLIAVAVIAIRRLERTRTAAGDEVLDEMRVFYFSTDSYGWLPDTHLISTMFVSMSGTRVLRDEAEEVANAAGITHSSYIDIGGPPRSIFALVPALLIAAGAFLCAIAELVLSLIQLGETLRD